MSLRRTLRRGGDLVATSGPARVGAAVVRKGSGAVSTPSDAQRDFAALGQLGLIARPSLFDRLRLGRLIIGASGAHLRPFEVETAKRRGNENGTALA